MKNLYSKNLILKFLVSATFIMYSLNVTAQIEVEPTGPIFSPESLITNIFLGEGVEVTNLTYNGSEQAVGYFTNGLSDIGIDRGIIMSSGFAITAATANTAGGTTGNTTGSGTDPDLGPIASGGLNDIARYEITFIPTSDTLQFRYVFASEEYPEYACSPFNDVFGFFLTGPNPAGGSYNGQNIALVPDPADPTGQTFTNIPVTINNVNNQGVNPGAGCNFDYSTYYNDNSGSMTLTYDAYLDIFTAQAIVIPCQEYTIKLAVADVGDGAFDTGVFLEAKSFGTGALEVEFASLSLDGTITEDCASAVLTFALPSLVEADYPIDYTIIGTAENGVDYQQIPLDLTIAQGDSSVSVDVIAWEDGIPENIESIGIDVQRDPCNRDTFWLFIRDNELVPPQLGPDTTICQGDSVQLDGTLPIPLPVPPIFTSTTDYPIVTISNNNPPPPGTPPTKSEIQVFGVQPTTLQEGVIKRICIDIDHNWISDVDVFLLGPNDQFIELTTDNGGSGNDYTSTCFTPLATNEINFGSQAPPSAAPFTGDWLPEGNWEDLWSIQNPQTNGIWTLQIKDDQTGFNGTLLGWSICFNPVYQLSYEWTPSTGLSCADCPDPVASPDTTTTYYLTVTDTYGCAVYDTITVNVLAQLPPPDVTCGNITDSSIEFCWDPIAGANDYEVNVDGAGWISTSNNLCFNVTGLTLEDTVTIQVAGISDCSGMIDTLTCWTPACTPPGGSILSQTPADCFGASTGSATVEAMGIYPPFEYMIVGVDTNSTGIFNDLAAGDYTVLVLDSVNCPLSIALTIDEPDEIITNEVLINNAACNGGTDGSVTVSVIGGTSPYSFNWSNLQTDSIATSLAVGEYYVTVTDAVGCSTIDTVNVVQPPVMNLTTEFDSVSCNGAGDGTATVIVTGGVGPYTYQWDANTSNQTDSIALGLDGGTYTVTVSDQNNCTTEIDVTVIENALITLLTSGTDISCFSGSDGTANVIANGGTGTYTYLWSDPAMQITETATGLQQGTVTVLVTDSDGCFATADVILSQPTALDVSTQTADAFCNGSNDGVITIITNGGTLPYTYDWSDTPAATDSTRIDLLAGDYMITITDGNGCTEVINIMLGEPDAIDLSFNPTDANCNGATDGSAGVNIIGGTGPFTFQWDANANNQTTALATDLGVGTYFVTVTDSNNCTSVASVDIGEPTALSLSNNSSDVLCFGNNTGSIDLSISGGTTPYNILWNGPNGYTSTLEDIATLFSGSYDVLVTDANNCTATLSVNINQPATGIMSTISPPDSICFEDGNGTVNVTVGGGTGPFTYAWNNGATTPTVSNLDGGMYIVTITDNGSCTFIDTAFVVEESEITINLSQTGTLCNGGADGTASIVSIFIGNTNTPISEFDLFWNAGGQTTSTINSLTGGQTYSVTVTNAMGCTASESITIDNPDEIESRIDEVTDASCFEGDDGSSKAIGEGGVAPYTYLWDAAANNQTTATATGLSAGIYTVTVTDSNGCSTAITTTVGQPQRLSLDFDTDGTDCYGDPSGSAAVNVQGGIPAYAYQWSNGNTSTTIDSVIGGIYMVTVTDNNGCTVVDEATVSQPDPLAAQIDVVDVSCFGGRDGELTFLPEGGTAPYTYSLDGIEYNGSNIQIALTAGTYGAYLIDTKGCEIYVGDYTVEEPDPITVDLGETIYIQYGESVTLNPTITGGFGNISYSYNPIDSTTLSCLSCQNPIASPEYANDYQLLVTDENGCTSETFVRVIVEKDWPVYVPTGFTPNNDQINDVLLIHGENIQKILMFRVYDRWGEMVFEASDYEYDAVGALIGWDGKFRDEELNPGVFVWYVEVEYIDGTTSIFKGNTTLIK
jgi:gliding motility-associated-like protein